ncbi:cytochrome P450 [Streptomyces sp. NPDC001228]|uniref:cytochrome P450 n=1 Tax=Streptomyces sp. NPDC001228 TaxID=3154381 RepID=UPI00332C05AD
MAKFRIPEMALPFPPVKLRDDVAEFKEELCGWAVKWNLIGLRGRDRMLSSDLLEWGIGMTGEGSRERAMLLCRWCLWILVIDDRMDSGPWALDGDLPEFTRRVVQAMEPGAVAPGPEADPMLRVLAVDLWPATSEIGDQEWLADLARHVEDYLLAEFVMVEHRKGNRKLTPAVYRDLHRDLITMEIFFSLLAAFDGPGRLILELTEPRRYASEVVSLANDLYGLERDLSLEEEANLVVLTRQEEGCSWQEAIDSVHRLFQERVSDLVRTLTAASRSEEIRGTANWVRDSVQATMEWHRNSSRYQLQVDKSAGSASGEVRTTERTSPSLFRFDFDRDPYSLYKQLREQFPVTWDESLDAWLVSRHEDVKAALTDPRLTSEGYRWQMAPLFDRTIIQMDGREHAASRKLLTPAFLGRSLDRLSELSERTAGELIERLQGRPEIELVDEFCTILPVSVLAGLMGLPAADVVHLKRWYQATIAYVGNHWQDPEVLRAGVQARDDFYTYLEPHIAGRRRAPGPDMLSLLCTAEVGGEPLPDETIKGTCGLLLLAGSETTAKGLSALLSNLLNHPEQLAAVQADATLIPQAWAETLRLNSPVQYLMREAAEPLEIGGKAISAGATVACLLGSANRDPQRFADPDRFDIFRADGCVDRAYTAAAVHVAFGTGRHFCLGARLSLVEAEVGISALLSAMPKPAWSDGFTPVERGQMFRGPERLLVTTGW